LEFFISLSISRIQKSTLAARIISVSIERYSKEFRDSSSFTSEKAEEVMTQFRTVKAFDCELYEAVQYAKGLDAVHDAVVNVSHIHALKTSVINLLSWGAIAPIIYYTGWLFLRKPYLGLGIGDVAVIVNSFSNIGISVTMVITALDDFRAAAYSSAKILSIIDSRPKKNRFAGEEAPAFRGDITFTGVTFTYAGAESPAVEDLTFSIKSGETVALVGESGCGKTTTLALLQRFYEIEAGEIAIDGVDVATYSPYSVRSQMSIVPQSPILFSMSIRDNICYAKPGATDAEVTRAAQIGNAHDFIMEIPENYLAKVEQTSLSGGQKQRICIARAILADAPILLLDEATAALDTESERLVQQALENFRHGKTTIVVAHRLATVRNADRILVFQKGKVIETGTHDELLAKNEVYANLIRFQLQ
jgi:ABC-type multidrug transport system fused ATPase/permease subunit